MQRRRYRSKCWPFGLGEPLDMGNFRGCLGALLFSCAATYFLWHTHDLYVWWDSLWGVESYIDRPKQRWSQLWAVIIGGSGAMAAILAMIMIPINRRRARKSAEGQWFDQADLTHEALCEEAPVQLPEAEKKVRPETPEPDAFWEEESTPTHLIMPAPVADSETGKFRLEKSDGRATLIVPSPKAPNSKKVE